MACFCPLRGYKAREVNETGKRSLVFAKYDGYADLPVEVPCGQCLGCRQERARQWAMRCAHEASLHERNCFITLTYDDDHLPLYGSLRKRDFQLFIKRLRKEIHPEKLRFFHSGEYGDDSFRPHYHALLFGWDFPDKYKYTVRNGYDVFRSNLLERLWDAGLSEIGCVTPESTAYVAKYVVKKLTGQEADARYVKLDEETGELVSIEPEYGTMSRRPGIGAGWFEKYHDEVYREDSVVVRGKKVRPPKYYDMLLEMRDPEYIERLKAKRRAQIDEEEQSPHRLTSRERVAYARLKNSKRGDLQT